MSNLHRIQWIDAQIRAKRYPNCRSIAEHFEISNRQASRDIEYLRYSMGAPIEYASDRNGYYYSSETFTLPKIFIGDEEKKALVYLADQYSALNNTQALRLAELFAKLTDGEGYTGTYQSQLPVIGVNPRVINVFHCLKEAIETHIAVEIGYMSPEGDETIRVISPYKLFTRNNHNYVAGFCELRKEIRVFRLDRIMNLTFTQKPFYVSPWFDEKQYDADSKFQFRNPYIGTIQSDQLIQLEKLKFSMRKSEKYLYTVEFYDSETLIQLLLSQRATFSILYPRWLKEKLKARLQKILEQN